MLDCEKKLGHQSWLPQLLKSPHQLCWGDQHVLVPNLGVTSIIVLTLWLLEVHGPIYGVQTFVVPTLIVPIIFLCYEHLGLK
jgi:hypothetical protein